MEERQREEGEEEGASPKGTRPSPAGEQWREPHVGFQELGPLPGESLQGHPQVSLTPQVVERTLWEYLLALSTKLLSASPPWLILFPPASSPSPPTLSRPGWGPGEAGV